MGDVVCSDDHSLINEMECPPATLRRAVTVRLLVSAIRYRMSRYWNPKDELATVRDERAKLLWPKGATAGLLAVATVCLGVTMVLYKVAGPRNVFKP